MVFIIVLGRELEQKPLLGVCIEQFSLAQIDPGQPVHCLGLCEGKHSLISVQNILAPLKIVPGLFQIIESKSGNTAGHHRVKQLRSKRSAISA